MKRNTGVVRAIGALKLVKGALLAAAAVGLFASRDVQSLFWRIVGYWNERALEAAGIVTGLYALVFLVEGGGLLLARRWAEWLTVIVTTSFIPLEIWKLVRHTTAPGVVTLVLNLAVVVYLAVRLFRDREEVVSDRARRPEAPATALARPV